MNSLVNDKDLPVQVEAGIAVSRILDRHSEEGKILAFYQLFFIEHSGHAEIHFGYVITILISVRLSIAFQ